jgi:hypothetical protein
MTADISSRTLAKHAAKTKLFEIYGLEKKERGRACDLHQDGCGNHVEVGYVFCLNNMSYRVFTTDVVVSDGMVCWSKRLD